MSALLEGRGLSKVYGGGLFNRKDVTVALDDVTYSVPDDRPSITAVAGESGSGKSTLALLLMGFIAPTSGQVLYRGRDLARMSGAERKQFRREVQPIFQDPYEAFNPFYKVDHVLSTPLRRFKLATSAADERRQIEDALEKVGLRPRETLGRFPHQLSGGQRQRIGVARALLCRPRVIVADEPVSMVDASLRATILGSLQALNRDYGISIIYITHDLTTAYQISESIIVLYRGAVVEAGSVEQVIQAPKHPYTRLLISSIPVPDRSQRWGAEAPPEAEAAAPPRPSVGCRFAPRCPSVMPVCWERRPPLYRPDDWCAAACFLYEGAPELASADVAQVFPRNGAPEPAHQPVSGGAA
jgi:oligopeptide/dipeptide ABC transporter ATP-binding protein